MRVFTFSNVMCFFWKWIRFSSWLMGVGHWMTFLLVTGYLLVRVLGISTLAFWVPLFFVAPPIVFWLFVFAQLMEAAVWLFTVHVLARLGERFHFLKFKEFSEAHPPVVILVLMFFGIGVGSVWDGLAAVWNGADSRINKFVGDDPSPGVFARWVWLPITSTFDRHGLNKCAELQAGADLLVRTSSAVASSRPDLKQCGIDLMEKVFGNSSGWKDLGVVGAHSVVASTGGVVSKELKQFFDKKVSIHVNGSTILDKNGVHVYFSSGMSCSDVVLLGLETLALLRLGYHQAPDAVIKNILKAPCPVPEDEPAQPAPAVLALPAPPPQPASPKKSPPAKTPAPKKSPAAKDSAESDKSSTEQP